jgi:ribosome-associated protein
MTRSESQLTETWKKSGIIKEVKFKAALSGGKGGQNVNKVNTKVELYWTPYESEVLTEDQKNKVISKLAKKLSGEGELRLVAEEERSQLKNKELVKEKFYKLIADCFKEKKIRKSTKPTKSSVEKRLGSKSKIKNKKDNRKKPDF